MNEKEYQSRIAELEALLEEKSAWIAYLEEQFRVAQHKQFGKSTEGHSGQGELFNEAEELVVEAETETAEEAISYTRKKPVRKTATERPCLVKLSFTTLLMKKKSVAVAPATYIALVKISQRSFSLSQLRSK